MSAANSKYHGGHPRCAELFGEFGAGHDVLWLQ